MSLDTPKREECGAEKIHEEIMAENFPKFGKEIKQNYELTDQEVQQTSNSLPT